ncbi:MAG: hypothetical protein KAI66_13890 [Lentisphaeria bacterium]|nr:hypothetical protein [Lentisphaeria bacterium]
MSSPHDNSNVVADVGDLPADVVPLVPRTAPADAEDAGNDAPQSRGEKEENTEPVSSGAPSREGKHETSDNDSSGTSVPSPASAPSYSPISYDLSDIVGLFITNRKMACAALFLLFLAAIVLGIGTVLFLLVLLHVAFAIHHSLVKPQSTAAEYAEEMGATGVATLASLGGSMFARVVCTGAVALCLIVSFRFTACLVMASGIVLLLSCLGVERRFAPHLARVHGALSLPFLRALSFCLTSPRACGFLLAGSAVLSLSTTGFLVALLCQAPRWISVASMTICLVVGAVVSLRGARCHDVERRVAHAELMRGVLLVSLTLLVGTLVGARSLGAEWSGRAARIAFVVSWVPALGFIVALRSLLPKEEGALNIVVVHALALAGAELLMVSSFLFSLWLPPVAATLLLSGVLCTAWCWLLLVQAGLCADECAKGVLPAHTLSFAGATSISLQALATGALLGGGRGVLCGVGVSLVAAAVAARQSRPSIERGPEAEDRVPDNGE